MEVNGEEEIMKLCSEECTPCCDYCKYVVHEVIEFENNKVVSGPIFVNYTWMKSIDSQRGDVVIARTFGV